jgi:hypothetical protein
MEVGKQVRPTRAGALLLPDELSREYKIADRSAEAKFIRPFERKYGWPNQSSLRKNYFIIFRGFHQ